MAADSPICRDHGAWGGPAAVRFSGESFSAQIGGESTDVVMLVMSRRDGSEYRKLYGHDVNNKAILEGAVPPPDVATKLRSELARYSPAK